MKDVRIIWSVSRKNAQIGAISIGPDTYYIYFGPGLPKVLDANMQPMVIPNIDSWIVAKTKHRYSLVSLQDMVEAYYEGANSAYSDEDVKSLLIRSIDLAVKRLCRSDMLDEVNKLYWIESASAMALRNLIDKMRIDFDGYKTRLGEDVLFIILCRIHRTCSLRRFDGTDTIAALASRMGRVIADPKYPDLDGFTSKIVNDVLDIIINEQVKYNTDEVLKSILV